MNQPRPHARQVAGGLGRVSSVDERIEQRIREPRGQLARPATKWRIGVRREREQIACDVWLCSPTLAALLVPTQRHTGASQRLREPGRVRAIESVERGGPARGGRRFVG